MNKLLRKMSDKDFYKKHKWIILASIFFIIWKFFLIQVLWQNRISPPEPDDSYAYISQIDSIIKCKTFLCEYPNISMSNYSGLIYFSYRIFFGTLAKIANISAFTMYHMSFYIGTILLLPVLIYFVKIFTKDAAIIAVIIFFLALYHGTGETHGFFWVVPSFFSTLLFFLIFAITINKDFKKFVPTIACLLPAFIYAHPTSIYFILILPIHFVFYSLLTKNIDFVIFKRISFIILASFILYFVQIGYLKIASVNSTPVVISSTLTEATNHSVQLRIASLSSTYFSWIMPNWIAIIPFILVIITIFYFKNFSLISFYLSSLVFFVISTLANDYGFRSAIILWPATFILYAFGFCYILQILKNNLNGKFKQTTLGILFTFLFVFIAINILYSIIVNSNMNIRNNYVINEDFIDYVISRTKQGDSIYVPDTLRFFSDTSNLPRHNVYLSIKDSPDYVLKLDNDTLIHNSILNTLTQEITKKINLQQVSNSDPGIYGDLFLEKKFGSVNIYSKIE